VGTDGTHADRLPEQDAARAEVGLVDRAVLPGTRLVAPVVVALEGVEDLGERGLDVRGGEVVAGVRDRDGRGRAGVAVDVAEQVRELAVYGSGGERVRAAGNSVRADARGAGRARGLQGLCVRERVRIAARAFRETSTNSPSRGLALRPARNFPTSRT